MLLAAVTMVVSALVSGTSAGAATPAADQDQSQSSPVERYRNNYGAISMAQWGGAVGWSYDHGTKGAARKLAQRECKAASDYPDTCRKIAWVRNGCLALFVRWSGNDIARWGWGASRSKAAAKRRARSECGRRCVYRAFTCTSRGT